MPSRFLGEVPQKLLVNLGEAETVPQVDLEVERHAVRQSVKRAAYTGKTYNSLENISQFFAERGMPFPPKPAPARPPAPSAVKPKTAPPVPSARFPRAGMTVQHPKYGTGTVVRREGEGDNAKITVSFPGHGLKKLVEKYAGLKKGP